MWLPQPAPEHNLMDAIDWAGLLVSLTGLLAAIGAGLKWLIGFIERQATKTIVIKDAQIAERDERIRLLEMENDMLRRTE